MNITVLNGSPKGPTSATMQYVHYIQKKFPEHELQIISISQRIEKLKTMRRLFRIFLMESVLQTLFYGLPLFIIISYHPIIRDLLS